MWSVAKIVWMGVVLWVVPRPAAAAWDVLIEPALGTRVEIPTHIFSTEAGASPRGAGRVLTTEDGRAVLAIYSLSNKAGTETPRSYIPKNFSVPEAAVDYKRVTRRFFALSAVYQDEIYYSRCNFSRVAGGAIHCFDLKYPLKEKRAWDPIVTRISLSLRPLQLR